MTKQSSELNSTLFENFSITDFSPETLLANKLTEFPASCTHNNLLSSVHIGSLTAITAAHTITVDEDVFFECKKRKAREQSTRNRQNISTLVSTTEFGGNTNTGKRMLSKGKKARSNEEEAEKAGEVIHVRARRGEATDSHGESK